MRIKILRQRGPHEEPYWENFEYDGPTDITVAALLDRLNFADDIINAAGEKTARLAWDCSCLQGICGACAMVINGRPALACETFLSGLREKEVVLRPLQKFPVIRDLIVDRTSLHENLKRMNVFIGEYHPKKGEAFRHQYEVAKCLKCGLCLEICPNYTKGEKFFGAVFANDCYLVDARNKEKSGEIRKVYGEHFAGGCSKSLACEDICPMGIPTLSSIAKLNKRYASVRHK